MVNKKFIDDYIENTQTLEKAALTVLHKLNEKFIEEGIDEIDGIQYLNHVHLKYIMKYRKDEYYPQFYIVCTGFHVNISTLEQTDYEYTFMIDALYDDKMFDMVVEQHIKKFYHYKKIKDKEQMAEYEKKKEQYLILKKTFEGKC